MLRIALCDDDIDFVELFKAVINTAFQNRQLTYNLNDYIRCDLMLDRHSSHPFDLIFLDIDMPDIDGFDAAKEITKKSNNCYIVFVTCHTELVYDSFMFRPLNFIVKDQEQQMLSRLDIIIDQLLEQMVQDEMIILESKTQGKSSFPLREIIYIESCDHYVYYHIKGVTEPIKSREKLSDIEMRLAQKDFVRIHKKYIVNLRNVFNIDLSGEAVILKDHNELPMSRNYKTNVKELLTDYLRKSR